MEFPYISLSWSSPLSWSFPLSHGVPLYLSHGVPSLSLSHGVPLPLSWSSPLSLMEFPSLSHGVPLPLSRMEFPSPSWSSLHSLTELPSLSHGVPHSLSSMLGSLVIAYLQCFVHAIYNDKTMIVLHSSWNFLTGVDCRILDNRMHVLAHHLRVCNVTWVA